MERAKRAILITAGALLASALLLLVTFFLMVNWHYFFDLRSHAQHFDRAGSIVRTEDGVRIEWRNDGQTVRYAAFSHDRRLLDAEGFTPIQLDVRNLWGFWSYDAFTAAYGDYHADISSGVFWPCWVTDDGYMISLWLGGRRYYPMCISNIGEVHVYDLLAEAPASD